MSIVFRNLFRHTSSWYNLWLVNFDSLRQPRQSLGIAHAETRKKNIASVWNPPTLYILQLSFWHEKRFFWKLSENKVLWNITWRCFYPINSKARAKMVVIVNRSIKLNYSRSRSTFFLELNRTINRVNGLRQLRDLMPQLVSFFPGFKIITLRLLWYSHTNSTEQKRSMWRFCSD